MEVKFTHRTGEFSQGEQEVKEEANKFFFVFSFLSFSFNSLISLFKIFRRS